MIRSACKILNKVLLSNDIFTFCVNTKYHKKILGLAIIKIFFKMSFFFKIIYLKSQNFKKLQKEKIQKLLET